MTKAYSALFNAWERERERERERRGGDHELVELGIGS